MDSVVLDLIASSNVSVRLNRIRTGRPTKNEAAKINSHGVLHCTYSCNFASGGNFTKYARSPGLSPHECASNNVSLHNTISADF